MGEKSKKPTIKTIAKLAGVSHVAVSRALRGCSDISPATTQRILKIAAEVGYTPNAFARNLSQSRSGGIGMIVPGVGNEALYASAFARVSALAADHDYCVSLGVSGGEAALEAQFCRLMCENQAGAIIVVPSGGEAAHIREACRGVAPIIFAGGMAGQSEEYCAAYDHHASAALAVEHLAGLGHSDIGLFLYGPADRVIQRKMEGFVQQMEKRGLVPRVFTEGHSSEQADAGARLARRLMDAGELPKAIWCASDLMAAGALDALQRAGVAVPGDVSVMGHDDLPFARLPGIGLTTLRMPGEAMGEHAARLALHLMGEIPEAVAHRRVFAPELVVRGTTGPA